MSKYFYRNENKMEQIKKILCYYPCVYVLCGPYDQVSFSFNVIEKVSGTRCKYNYFDLYSIFRKKCKKLIETDGIVMHP